MSVYPYPLVGKMTSCSPVWHLLLQDAALLDSLQIFLHNAAGICSVVVSLVERGSKVKRSNPSESQETVTRNSMLHTCDCIIVKVRRTQQEKAAPDNEHFNCADEWSIQGKMDKTFLLLRAGRSNLCYLCSPNIHAARQKLCNMIWCQFQCLQRQILADTPGPWCTIDNILSFVLEESPDQDTNLTYN